jgi:hypothetical protein
MKRIAQINELLARHNMVIIKLIRKWRLANPAPGAVKRTQKNRHGIPEKGCGRFFVN